MDCAAGELGDSLLPQEGANLEKIAWESSAAFDAGPLKRMAYCIRDRGGGTGVPALVLGGHHRAY